jgi:enterochelin esterase-like enzyme
VARRVVVYTPPDYSASNKKYPVVYLLHGANDYELGWTQTGTANTIMDNLIADKKAVPAIIVNAGDGRFRDDPTYSAVAGSRSQRYTRDRLDGIRQVGGPSEGAE